MSRDHRYHTYGARTLYLDDLATDIELHEPNNPLRQALAAHLRRLSAVIATCSEARRGDSAEEALADIAVRTIVSPVEEASAAIDAATRAQEALQQALDRLHTNLTPNKGDPQADMRVRSVSAHETTREEPTL